MEEFRKNLEKQSYIELLRQWRFGINPDQFQGEKGEIFSEIMFRKKNELSHDAQVKTSKNIGWEQNENVNKIKKYKEFESINEALDEKTRLEKGL